MAPLRRQENLRLEIPESAGQIRYLQEYKGDTGIVTAPQRVSEASPVRGRVRLCQNSFPWRYTPCARFISKSGRTIRVPKSQARLEEVLARRRAATKPVSDIEAFGQVLHALFSASETEVVGDDLAGFDINAPVVMSSLDRLPKQLGRRWEKSRVQFEEARGADDQVPCGAVTVTASLDGVMPPMKDGQRAERRAEAAAEGKRIRGSAGHVEAAYGETSPKGPSHFEKLRHLLLDQRRGVEKVIRAFVHLRDTHPRTRKIETQLRYVRRSRLRMRHAELRAKGHAIGFGVVEAACKTDEILSVERCVEHAPSTPTRRRPPTLSTARIRRPQAHSRSGSQNT